MYQTTKEKLKLIIIERIKQVQAQKNPKDSKYPLVLNIDVTPTSTSNLNISHPSYRENYKKIIYNENIDSLTRTIRVEGDYAKRGGTGKKTLRLKINKADWPSEWSFPWKEIDRRLFLQNFRLNNLNMLTPFDEDGEEYEKLFPPEPDAPVEIVFDEEDSESAGEEIDSTQSGLGQTNNDKILEALEALDYLADEAREEGEPDFAASISEAYMALLREALKNKNKR